MSWFTKKTWTDRNVEHPSRRKLTLVSGESDVYDVTRNEGTITNPGDAFNAGNMNDLESRIEAGLVKLEEDIKSATVGTLTAGSTTITLNDSKIQKNSILSFATSIGGVNPNTYDSDTGYVTLTFDAQSVDMLVAVQIEGTYGN